MNTAKRRDLTQVSVPAQARNLVKSFGADRAPAVCDDMIRNALDDATRAYWAKVKGELHEDH